MTMNSNNLQHHEKLLEELRAVIDNASKMLSYTRHHTSDQCQEARRRLEATLDMARMELATFEAAHQARIKDTLPAMEHARQVYSGENAIFRAFR